MAGGIRWTEGKVSYLLKWIQKSVSGLLDAGRLIGSLAIRIWIQVPLSGLLDAGRFLGALATKIWIQAPIAGLIDKWEKALSIRLWIQAPIAGLIDKWESTIVAVKYALNQELLEGLLAKWEKTLSVRIWIQKSISGILDAGRLIGSLTLNRPWTQKAISGILNITGRVIASVSGGKLQEGSLSWIVGALTVVIRPGMLKGRLAYRLFMLAARPLSGNYRGFRGTISRGPFKYSRTVSREI